MKVLEKCTPKEWSMEVRCTGEGNGDFGCGSLLEVTQGDLFETCTYDCGQIDKRLITIECPVCQKLTDIPRDLVPLNIRNCERKSHQQWKSMQ